MGHKIAKLATFGDVFMCCKNANNDCILDFFSQLAAEEVSVTYLLQLGLNFSHADKTYHFFDSVQSPPF